MKNPFIALFVTLAVFVFASQFAWANKLLMFDDDDCSWCRKWDEEIGAIYHLTPESCQASLQQIKLGEKLPESVSINESVEYTPTFVLLHNDEEVGRIVGYPGQDFFWSLLNEMIDEKIPEKVQTSNAANCKKS